MAEADWVDDAQDDWIDDKPAERGAGAKTLDAAMDYVIEPAAAALDYTYAPVRQAVAAPAKAVKAAIQGDVKGVGKAFVDPITQLFSRPSSAPSSAEVMEMYGVPKEKKVQEFAVANPLTGSTYEMNPAGEDSHNVTVNPSISAAMLMDTFLGGAGIGAAGKASNLAKGAGSLLRHEKNMPTAAKAINGISSSVSAPPQSFQEMENVLRTSGRMGSELPSSERLLEIESILPELTHKPTPLHREMLSSYSKADELKAKYTQLPTKEREILDKYNLGMRQELQDRMLKEASLKNPSPREATKAGDDIMSSIQNRYTENKRVIGPMFEAIDNVRVPKKQHIDQLVNRIASEVPNVGKSLEVAEDGALVLKPYRTSMGLSRKEYSEVQGVIESINEGSLDFKEMQNMRETLRKAIDPVNPGETADLQGLRKSLLNHMEDVVQTKNPDIEVKDAFRRWAKNEADLDIMTDVLGGKVGGFDDSLKADPSKALNRIFQNTKNARIAKKTLPPEEFEALVGDLIGDIYSKAFDSAKNQVSSARFMAGLRRHGGVLKEIDPEQYRRLEALGDMMKILPDMPNVNPSGSAKTILSQLKDFTLSPIQTTGQKIDEVVTGSRAKNSLENIMSGARTTPGRQMRPSTNTMSNMAKGSAMFLQPQPMTEDDVHRLNIPNSEKAQKINMIRRGVQVFD